MQDMEDEETAMGTGKVEWGRRHEGRVDLLVMGGGEGVLQLQHTKDVGMGWGA